MLELSRSLDFSDAEGSTLDALSTVGNKSELMWFCRKGSPAETDWKPGPGVGLLHR